MRRSTRDILGGLSLLILCLLLYIGLRIVVSHYREEAPAELSEKDREAVERFEADRRQDSARQQAHWDSLHAAWDAEKAARQAARDAREQAYADSQRVWAAQKAERRAAAEARKAHYDSIRATYPKKLPRGSMVDANSADTTLLKQIPGIGSVYARRIVSYRESLGGFISAQQIEEIEGLPYGIASWFRVAQNAEQHVRRININRADFKTLVRHPYLSYEQTKYIANLRQRTGRIRGWEDLRGSGLFSEADVARLTTYFTF